MKAMRGRGRDSYEKASQEVRCDGHRFCRSLYVLLLSALVMDLLGIRCMLGSVVGCCYLQSGLIMELSFAPVPAAARSHPDGTSKNG